MKIDVLLSNGELLTYYGKVRYSGGAAEIKTENPCRGIIVIPLAYIEEIKHEEIQPGRNNSKVQGGVECFTNSGGNEMPPCDSL